MSPEILFKCLRLLFETGLLVALAGGIAWGLRLPVARSVPGLRLAAPTLALARALLLAALAFPTLVSFAPRERLLEPQATLVSALPRDSGGALTQSFWLSPVAGAPARAWVPARRVALDSRTLALVLAAALAGSLAMLARSALAASRLSRWVRSQPTVRSVGRVTVRATSAAGAVPFSALIRNEAAIILPVELLRSPRDARIAIRHELQHHRQRDTRWAYGLEALGCAFFWNPAHALWRSVLSQLQEFACDEALVGRRRVSPQAYGRCMLRVAELAVGLPVPAGLTVGMAVGSSGSLLKRRVEMLFAIKQVKGRAAETAALGAVAMVVLALVGTAAYAARSAIQDRSLTLSELQARANTGDPGAEIPLVINEQVLRELNRYVGTEDGRDEIRKALARMPQYQPMIERKLKESGLPKDLVIVPLIESGYTNYFNPHRVRGAGLWGFIPTTARRYDMRVDELGVPGRVDDRLNEERETVAAARYFRDLYNLFQDWRLALKGYNEGENRVAKLIMELGTRDAWEIERQAESKERYLAKITAALLIYKNPRLLE